MFKFDKIIFGYRVKILIINTHLSRDMTPDDIERAICLQNPNDVPSILEALKRDRQFIIDVIRLGYRKIETIKALRRITRRESDESPTGSTCVGLADGKHWVDKFDRDLYTLCGDIQLGIGDD